MFENNAIRFVVSLLLGVSVGAVTGCAGASEEVEEHPLRVTHRLEDGRRLVISDVDQDGQADVRKYFGVPDSRADDPDAEEVLLVTEMDLSGDGLFNLRRSYDEHGELSVEEMDGNLDGDIDHRVFWQNGVIMRTERDENSDGLVDEFRYYREGYLNRVLRDRDGDSEVDTWAYYDRTGLARVGYDTTGDGAADSWTRREDEEEVAPEVPALPEAGAAPAAAASGQSGMPEEDPVEAREEEGAE